MRSKDLRKIIWYFDMQYMDLTYNLKHPAAPTYTTEYSSILAMEATLEPRGI